MTQIAHVLRRSRVELLQDAFGVVALAVMTVVSLHLPMLLG